MTDFATAPEYEWWRKALAGESPTAELHDPQCGFYFTQRKDKSRSPVVIYPHEGAVYAVIGMERKPIDPEEVWPYCYNKVISDDTYFSTIEAGEWQDTKGMADKPKPEEPATGGEVAPMGHNQGPTLDAAEEIKSEIETAISVFNEAAGEDGITDDATADRVANSRDRLRELRKRAEDKRVEEKRPHDEAAKAVQQKWKPILELAERAIDRATKVTTAWLTKKEREQEEARRKAEEERRAAEDAQRQAELGAIERGEAPPAPLPEPESVAAPEPTRVGGGITGRRTGLRTVKSAVITDWDKLFESLKDRAEMRETAQSLANTAARAGITLPGCEIREEKIAT